MITGECCGGFPAMRDVLGWRRKFGVIGPSTNTVVQLDFDMMRPAGVTNHYSRIFTPNAKAVSNETFMAGIQVIGDNVLDAVRSVMTCEPDYLVMDVFRHLLRRRRRSGRISSQGRGVAGVPHQHRIPFQRGGAPGLWRR